MSLRGIGSALLIALVVLVPAWAGEGGLKTSAPVYNGRLAVTLHFQGDRLEVLSQETPGELHLLLPEGSRLVKLVLDRPDRLHHQAKPALITRSYKRAKRNTVSGGAVLQEEYKDYADTQTFEWKGLPPGPTDLAVESQPDGSRLDVTGLEIPR